MRKVMAKWETTGSGARCGLVSRSFCIDSPSRGATPLRRQQSSPQQIQVRQCEGGMQPCGVLRQAAVANLGKAPQVLDHVEGVLNTGASGGATAVNEPPVVVQRLARRA